MSSLGGFNNLFDSFRFGFGQLFPSDWSFLGIHLPDATAAGNAWFSTLDLLNLTGVPIVEDDNEGSSLEMVVIIIALFLLVFYLGYVLLRTSSRD